MKNNSLTELNYIETKQVSGGFGFDTIKILEGATASAFIKMTAYYIEFLIPKGEKETFTGELWNGMVKGISNFISILSVAIGGYYIVAAVRKNPNTE